MLVSAFITIIYHTFWIWNKEIIWLFITSCVI